MIKANELRLGNWVICRGEIEQIELGHFEQLGDCALEDKDFEPIPLTPELLEKLGFEKRKPYFTAEWCKGDFEINVEEDGYAVFASEWTIGKPFKYLHQLQNIYFDLNDEELPVTL